MLCNQVEPPSSQAMVVFLLQLFGNRSAPWVPLPTSSCARRWHGLRSGQEESVGRIWGVLTVN